MADQQTVFGDRYQIVRHIARGGMAQVYLARDLLLDRPVALKVLFPELSVDEAFVERFRREAQAAANLSHPNIVSIYDWGQGDRTYFIVMEYVDGETLSARIRRSPLPADQAAAIASATASALAFAHQRNVIHRDVKPGNVLIDQSGQVKVADFGIARAVGAAENLTQAGAVMGTATYFSPEQAQGFAVDARSDVYSLGVVLYEMVVGKPPFQGDNPVSIAYKHVREAPVPPRSRNSSVPAAYEAIVLEALAKDPEARYQTADELRADLERFRAGRRVLAATNQAADATTALAGATSVMGGVAAFDATRAVRPVDPTSLGRRPVVATVPPRRGDDDTGPIPGEGPSRTGWYVAAVVALIAVLAVLGYFIGKDLGWFGGTKALTVPPVAGQSQVAAQAALTDKGFTAITDKKVTSSKIKAGDATGTVPATGSKERADTPITLEISAGPASVSLPDVTNQSLPDAETTLHQHGFTTTVAKRTSDTVAAGAIIKTNPAGGKLVAPGSSVELFVSTGRRQVQIPSFLNQGPVQAANTLTDLGFKPTQQNESSSTVANGLVTRTSPPALSREPQGSAVIVYVSTGPAMVTVPSVVGLTENAADAQLSQSGLKVSITTTPVSDRSQNNRVQQTNPPGQSSVAAGSTVDVVVGSYTAPTTTTSTSTTTTTLPGGTTTTSSTSLPGKHQRVGRD